MEFACVAHQTGHLGPRLGGRARLLHLNNQLTVDVHAGGVAKLVLSSNILTVSVSYKRACCVLATYVHESYVSTINSNYAIKYVG